ncbi:MoaD/ThiS family protein [Chitinivorax sp. B]|uniref:MoaD/ThiS family protein n=1 Tax=Chitinivorax sp. B TaxID=2502235 RepID=UPI0010FA2FB5|nr:MoaD/ThiS family protein [Chitinivorax sp. B]
MPTIAFTRHLRQYLPITLQSFPGETLEALLVRVFTEYPSGRLYVLDEQGRLRRHIAIFVDGVMLQDRQSLNVPLRPDSEVYVMQALSGG